MRMPISPKYEERIIGWGAFSFFSKGSHKLRLYGFGRIIERGEVKDEFNEVIYPRDDQFIFSFMILGDELGILRSLINIKEPVEAIDDNGLTMKVYIREYLQEDEKCQITAVIIR